jgi:hypothetical protein
MRCELFDAASLSVALKARGHMAGYNDALARMSDNLPGTYRAEPRAAHEFSW